MTKAMYSRLLALAAALVFASAAEGASITATFNNATDAPVTAAGYTATGNTVDFTLNFAPGVGKSLTVVKNTSLGFINGTFDNLAQGQAVMLSFGGKNYNFVANYYGGTGNDLVLVWAGNRVVSWGENYSGQLGNNSTTSSSLPVDVLATGVLAGKTVVAISAGRGDHNLVLCSDGTLAAWGFNGYGQVGDGTTTDAQVPTLVTTAGTALEGKTAIAVSAGVSHSLALCSDGTLAAWGQNDQGQLGNNSTTDTLVPIAVNTAGTPIEGKTVVAIAVGYKHNVALCSDGTLVAWGLNTNGQLGNNSTTASLVPVAVSIGGTALEGKAVTAIVAGKYHNLALCSDGTMVGWGSNGSSQLGNYSSTITPVQVDTTGTVLEGKLITALAAGQDHNLALCSDGTLAAWGYSPLLGINIVSGRGSRPVAVGTSGVLAGKTVIAIAASDSNSLVACSDGTVAAWGENFSGQLGVGTAGASNGTSFSLVPVATHTTGTALAGTPSIGMVAGFNRSLALVAPPLPVIGRLSASAAKASGGTNVTITGSHLSGASGITIGGSAATNVVVINDKTLTCTTPAGSVGNASVVVTTPVGSNGANTLFSYLPSVLTAHFNSASDVPFSYSGFAASQLTINFALGYAPVTGASLMVIKNTGQNFISGTFSNLAQGQAVALSYNGTIYNFVANYYGGTGNDLVLQWAGTRAVAWGGNMSGELGNNSNTINTVPVDVLSTGVLAGKTVIAVSAGNSFSMALCSDGTLATWGNNSGGQLGNNSYPNSNVPVAVSKVGTALNGKTVVAIASGAFHNLALCSDGTVAAWGSTSLGNNSITPSRVPVAVNTEGVLAGKTVVAIAAGFTHSLALCSDGTLAAWGDNSSGQLGNNSTSASAVPVAVSTDGVLGIKFVVAIAAGNSYSLALCSDGTMAAWGDNSSGQLGNNRATASSVPVAVSRTGATLANRTVVSIAAGGHHSLALCSDGTLAARGDNSAGQLGNNSTSNSLVPIATNITGLLTGTTVTGIASGASHSLALSSDGTISAWGLNIYGQVGNASSTNSLIPAAVNTDALAAGERFVAVSSGAIASHSLALVAPLPQPTLAVNGNSQAIVNGSAASKNNGTDFGTVPVLNAQLTHAFTITRTLGDPLNLNGSPLIAISGPAAADFHVTQSPATPIAPRESTTFAITFEPTVPGQRTATVTIANDSVDLPAYSFSVTGFSTLAAKRAQTIFLDVPAISFTNLLGQPLYPRSSSGLPVSLSISGPGSLGDYNGITYWSPSPIPGTIRITATQAGDSTYLPAPPVTRTITVIKLPSTFKLAYLQQTYDGTPKPAYAFDANGHSGIVTYKVGASYVADAPTAAGVYAVKGVLGSTTLTGTLVITKAPLLVLPDSKHKFAGQANPALTVSYSGFINGDTSSVITKEPVPSTTVTVASPGGIYPITASGGLAANYTFVFGQGSMVVDTFAGAYEALLVDTNPAPVGKLSITVAATSTTFTAKLATATETTAVSFTGTLVTGNEQATGTATTLVGADKTPYVINFTLPLHGPIIASATRGGVLLGSATDGQRISTSPVLFAGAHTAVFEPATPAATNVPSGAGWATVTAGTTGVLSFAGKLGDDTVFTASLSPDSLADPGYRLFAQPYVAARAQSYIAGQFNLLPHPSIAKRRYLPQSTLTWNKAGLATDATNRAGFGPVSTVLMIDPWLPNVAATKTAPAITLAQRLGLMGTAFYVNHTATGSAANGNLPTQLNLSATNVISVLTPLANPTKWKILTFAPTTGAFTGSFELVDGVTKRTPTFSGVFRQPATVTDTLIGDGHYLLTPTSGTEKTTGEVMFSQ